VTVKNLSTPQGRLSYRLAPSGGGYVLELAGGITPPAGGVHLAWPLAGALPRASHDGRELAWTGRELALPEGPATVRLVLGAGQ